MKTRIVTLLLISLFAEESLAFDLGVSSSGKDISLEIWSPRNPSTPWGANFKVLADFEKYENGSRVTVCSDGSISGSSGSGTCSGHGGVNHTKNAKFNRYAIAAAPTYWVTDYLQLHCGLIAGLYSSDVNIGDKGSKNFTEYGLDLGISIKPLATSEFKLVAGHETERSRSYLGVRVAI
ncbi:MAG: hypothetical protein QM808_09740 [Steroidobacteraceae bacterium]